MAVTLQSLGIDQLSVAERLRLIEEIWDSISSEAERQPLSAAACDEIDRRLAAHEANPGAAVPWEQVEAEALARLQK